MNQVGYSLMDHSSFKPRLKPVMFVPGHGEAKPTVFQPVTDLGFEPVRSIFTAILLLSLTISGSAADWPCLRGSADHVGYIEATLQRPFRLLWARDFLNERLGTAMEPIVANGKVFIATHAGTIYGLDAAAGEPLWRCRAPGPFLHSPAVINGLVVGANTDGFVYGIDANTGKVRLTRFISHGGFSASPLIENDRLFIGSRSGDFICLNLQNGSEVWKIGLNVPIRQTAALSDGKVFVTAEDLRVRCLRPESGELLWTSEQLVGQTARDYYPIIVKAGGRTFVIVRTNPILNMGQRIGRDRTMLARSAGADDSNWQKIETWIKSDASHGTPELWTKEQQAIIEYLQANRDAQTFFVLDAANGKEAFTAPVLWIAGCQGAGAEPALTSDGRLLVFYRSAYGNWNHGVAPLVTLGLYDLTKNQITPLFHQQGKKPAWNCFWGTADESQNFVIAGDTALIVHQGTLSGFDLKRNELFPIFGERDTYGGFRSPPWARNEWHGPARAGVAVVRDRIYWQTGSRILCLASHEQGKRAEVVTIVPTSVKTEDLEASHSQAPGKIPADLTKTVDEITSKRWAPLFVDPGLAGRDFSFDDSSELFEALAWARPHLPPELSERVEDFLAREWTNHPPYAPSASYSLKEGAPRELHWVPPEFRARLGGDKRPHPFGGVYAAWLYAQRCHASERVRVDFAKIKESFMSFEGTGWKLDPSKGDLFANRYLAALLAYAKLAENAGDQDSVARPTRLANETADALVAWWNRATGTLTNFNGSAQLDPFINSGDAISFRVAPHRHKIALFQDLTPEVAALVREKAPEAVERLWQTFSYLYATWYLVGEERQVHFGENFVDPPDLALNAFKALTWLRKADRSTLATRIDLPFCSADLYYAIKLALWLEQQPRI